MNIYGTQAKEYWRQFRPNAYAAITDPQGFFSTLGQQIADEVDLLTAHLAGPDVTGEGFFGKLSRLTSAKFRAEEIAMSQSVYSHDPEISDEDEDFPHSSTAGFERDFDREMVLLKALETMEMADDLDRAWRESQTDPRGTNPIGSRPPAR